VHFCPAQPVGTLYAAINNAEHDIFKSTDRGATWTSLGPLYVPVGGLVVDPSNPSTIYATAIGAGIEKTTDAGLNWFFINNGISGQVVSSLVMDP